MGHLYKEIRILHNNVNGIYTSRTELDVILTEQNPDIITLNETFLKPHNKLTYPNYNIIRKDRLDRQRGGVAILYKKHLPAIKFDLPKQFNKYESLTLKIQIPNYPIYVSTLYSPPDTPLPCDLITFLSKFHKSILLSDINAHHPALGDCPSTTNRKGKDLVELLEQSNFIHVEIPEPTRFPYTINGSLTSPDKIL